MVIRGGYLGGRCPDKIIYILQDKIYHVRKCVYHHGSKEDSGHNQSQMARIIFGIIFPGMYFALLSFATSLMAVCSPFLINGLFAYTIKIGFPQITFYVTSVILLFPMSLNG